MKKLTNPDTTLGTLLQKPNLTYREDFLDSDGKPTVELKLTIKSFARADVTDDNGRTKEEGLMFFEELTRPLILGPEKMRPLPGKPLSHIGKKVTLYGDPAVKYMGKAVGGIRIRVGWAK